MSTPPRTDLIHRDYLGDGAYVGIDRAGALILTAENGIEATDTVVLEDTTLIALALYMRRHFPQLFTLPGQE